MKYGLKHVLGSLLQLSLSSDVRVTISRLGCGRYRVYRMHDPLGNLSGQVEVGVLDEDGDPVASLDVRITEWNVRITAGPYPVYAGTLVVSHTSSGLHNDISFGETVILYNGQWALAFDQDRAHYHEGPVSETHVSGDQPSRGYTVTDVNYTTSNTLLGNGGTTSNTLVLGNGGSGSATGLAATRLFNGLTSDQCLARYEEMQRSRLLIPERLSTTQLAEARRRWSEELRTKAQDSKHGPRLSILVDLDVDD